MSLLSYIIKRSVYMLIVLFLAAVLNFFLFEYVPMAIFHLGVQFFVPCKNAAQCSSNVVYARVISEFGLNQSWPVRFEKYIVNVFHGNFGVCISQGCGSKPVWAILSQYAPNSILLLSVSGVLAVLLGSFLGVISASKRGKFVDVSSLSVSIFAFSVPVFWIGLLLIYFLSVQNHWFPLSLGQATIGIPLNSLRYFQAYLWAATLPILVLTFVSYGFYLLIMRNTMHDILTEDFITMARAKGLSERTVLYKHAFRNALLPVVTGVALAFGGILGGAVITETIFNFTGLGWALLKYIFGEDYPVLQGAFFLIAIMTILANFIADIAYGFLDPRVTY